VPLLSERNLKIRPILLTLFIPALLLLTIIQQIASAGPDLGQTAAPALSLPDPTVQSMIDQVELGTIYQIDGQLSGQLPVLIDGQPYTISTRHTNSGQAISNTTRFVGEKLSEFGLNVEYHQWADASNPNVIGELTGRRHPEKIYLISAHLDSTSPTWPNRAPGADDNASGSTAVLVAADILSQYQWDCTLRFALWTGEEQGMLGSQAYAKRAAGSAEDIAGVLNLDMIGWNTMDSEPGIDLHANDSITGSLELAQLFSSVVSAYDLALIPEIVAVPTLRSDHASFWQAGYGAILAIEDFADFNPYYHSTQDTADKLNLGFLAELVKASVGTLVHMGDCLVTGYLEGQVVADSDLSPIPSARVSAQDLSLPPIVFTSDAVGYYSGTLPAGVYSLTATAVGYEAASFSNRVVVTGSVTTQDFFLISRPPILLPLIRRNH
jgi:hypothetical protein